MVRRNVNFWCSNANSRSNFDVKPGLNVINKYAEIWWSEMYLITVPRLNDLFNPDWYSYVF